MKILMITDIMTDGGKERQIVELLKGFSQTNNVRCELIVLSDKIDYDEVYNLDVPIHLIKRKYKQDLSVFYKIYRVCKKFDPDIIQSWHKITSIYMLPTRMLLRAKLVSFIIQDAPPQLSKLSKVWIRFRIAVPFSDAIVANSQAGLNSYQVRNKIGYSIHNGFDANRVKNVIDKSKVIEKFNIRSKYIVGMVGAFEERKDYDTLISAAQQILEKRDDITFLLVGSGSDLERCKRLVSVKYTDRIIFTGRQRDVESIINVFDIGVLTTNHLVHGEGISNAIMEYMAMKKAVIATKGGGTSEIVLDNLTGFVIEPQNPDILAEKINFLLNNDPIRIQMGDSGRSRLLTEFSLEKMTKAFLNLYNLVLEKTPQPAD